MASTKLLAVSVVIGLLAAAAAASVGGSFGVEWRSVDGGGGVSSGGQFALTGAIGQPDTGHSSAGPYAIQGGSLAGSTIGKSAANSSWSQYR
jgi:hypothetical protein